MGESTLTYTEARYLKRMGELNNVKVSYGTVDGEVCIYIHDSEFKTFESALAYLQNDARSIAPREEK